MATNPESYAMVCALKNQGATYRDIERETGLSQASVVNICLGRTKAPGTKRPDAGVSKHADIDIVIERVKDLYFQQGRRKGNLSTCIQYALDEAARLAIFIPEPTLRRHVYARAKSEKWEMLWSSRKAKGIVQKYLPKMNYDYWPLVGYNDYWVIDGRKSDMWVHDGNKIFMPQGFYVMDLRTASYMCVSFSDKAFNARQVILLLLMTALKYGPPKLGILCDNGMEQIGQENIQTMEAFWDDEILQAYREGYGIDGFHTIYNGAISPVVTSLPRIPTEFAKARLERSFLTLQKKFDAPMAGTGYQGGSREDVVHTTLMRSPKQDSTWLSFQEYQKSMTWFLTAAPDDRALGILPYSAIQRPFLLKSFAQETGQKPTVGNAVAHCLVSHTPGRIADDNYWKIVYHALKRHDRKRVTRIGQVEFTSGGVFHSYTSPALTYDMVGQRVDVAVDPADATRAGIFYDGRCIGTAIDISRRVNTGVITVASGREMMGFVRKDAVKQLRDASDGYAIAPPHVDLATALPAPTEAIRIEATDTLGNQLALADDDTSDDMSAGTQDLLSRIYSE